MPSTPIHKSTANDKWAQYQSSHIKYHSLELGENLVDVMGVTGERTDRMLADYKRQKAKYGSWNRRAERTKRPRPPRTAPCASTSAKDYWRSHWS
jgi:hypothetical protein